MRVISPTRLRDERGATLVIVALSLVALFGMVVLTVDVGGLLTKRRGMVNGADAAALAAAQSYALSLNGAKCGTNDGPAQTTANTYANDNVAGATSTGYSADCVKQTVQVSYTVQQGLFFAPVLGFGKTSAVASTATAIWGGTGGGNPMPIELDPQTVNQCVYQNGIGGDYNAAPMDCPKGFWFNNQDLTNSGWGLMNLNTWGIDPAAACSDSGGSNALGGWILQTGPVSVVLDTKPTYVCTMDGTKSPNWLDDLKYWQSKVGEVLLFPENDPSQMVLSPSGYQKYAIVSFVPMGVGAVYKGNDPAAFGDSGVCDAKYTFSSGATTIDLTNQTTWTAVVSGNCGTPIPRSVDPTSLKLTDPSGKKYQPNSDYTYDSNTQILTWKGPVPTTPEISFSYKSGGPCAGHTSDPNAICLQLTWEGPQLIGKYPDPSLDSPAKAVTLIR